MFATDLENRMDEAASGHKKPAQERAAREQVLRKALNAGSTAGIYRDPAAGAKSDSVDNGDILNKPRKTSGFSRRRR